MGYRPCRMLRSLVTVLNLSAASVFADGLNHYFFSFDGGSFNGSFGPFGQNFATVPKMR